MPGPSDVERFSTELRALWQAAGPPLLATVVRRGRDEVPPLALKDATLSDWLGGRSVPSDPAAVRFLVRHLQSLAAARGGHPARPLDWWTRLHERARAQTRARRGRRAGRHPTDGPGRVVEELDDTDALALGVHQAAAVDDPGRLPVLPPYLTRLHDVRLRAELAAAAAGRGGRVVVLVGGPSTGKTRACFEAVRAVLPRWRLWHPLTPQRPTAVLRAVRDGRVAPRTVLWLDETQTYLRPAATGEPVASALHDLIGTPAGPVVVLGSMGTAHWEALTDPHRGRHAAARALLRGRDIGVPGRFDPEDLTRLAEGVAADPRLRTAAGRGTGRITQHLAGVPEIVRRYQRADDHARAVVWAAMDARRLSRWHDLPGEFLRRAAPGYLDRQVWDATGDGDGWFDTAVAYLSRPCHGVPGPLARRRPAPDGPPRPAALCLAEHLDQAGRRYRARHYPPATFWDAAERTGDDPGVLCDLAAAAEARGRLRRAYRMVQRAAELGDTRALRELSWRRQEAGDTDGAARLWELAADRGDAYVLWELGRRRELAGDADGARQLWRRAADRGDAGALGHLGRWWERNGDPDGARRLWQRAAEGGDPVSVRELASRREEAGDADGAERLWRWAADRGDGDAVGELTRRRERAGDHDGAERLARRAAERGDGHPLRLLARRRERAGDRVGAERLWRQAADRGDPAALCELAWRREDAGDRAEAERLWHTAAGRGDVGALCELAWRCERAGDGDGARRLWRQAADRGDTGALVRLAWRVHAGGDADGARRLLHEAADRGGPGALEHLARLREGDGDVVGAERLRRYGLTDDGAVSEPWE